MVMQVAGFSWLQPFLKSSLISCSLYICIQFNTVFFKPPSVAFLSFSFLSWFDTLQQANWKVYLSHTLTWPPLSLFSLAVFLSSQTVLFSCSVCSVFAHYLNSPIFPSTVIFLSFQVTPPAIKKTISNWYNYQAADWRFPAHFLQHFFCNFLLIFIYSSTA